MKKIYINDEVYGIIGDTDVDCSIPNAKVGDFLVCVDKNTEEIDDLLVLEKDEGENLFYSMLTHEFCSLGQINEYYHICCISKLILEEYLSARNIPNIRVEEEQENNVEKNEVEDKLLHELNERNLTEEKVIHLLEIIEDIQTKYDKTYDEVVDDMEDNFKFTDKFYTTICDYTVYDADDLENRLDKSNDYDDLRGEIVDAIDSIQNALDRY